MKKTLLLFSSFLMLLNSVTYAQTPVWSTDIAPIVFNKCASCHNQAGIAPFSLTEYDTAVIYSTSIAASVSSKYMPPWPPDPGFNRLAHERLLSAAEITKITDWVAGNTPKGDPTLEPPKPVFPAHGDLPGTPDLMVRIPTYTSTAATGDVYQCFVLPSNLSVDQFITAFEAVPGNRPLVHHVLVYADTTGNCAALDAATTEPGYTSFGGVGESSARLLGGWVPGTAPLVFPQGFGVKLPKNADIVVQIHYPEGTQGKKDSTEIHFFLSTATNTRDLNIDPILNHITNISPALSIPAGQTKSFTEHFKVPGFLNISLLGVAPHMHLIGRSIDCFGRTPQGDTQKYIKINDWDFHWQGFYMFRNIMKIPAGTDLYSNAFYDNTSNNPENPSNPPQPVTAGESTTDEMMLTYFIWTLYQQGDENIKIDSSQLIDLQVKTNYYREQQLLLPYPNPANDVLIVKYYFNNPAEGNLYITDMNGKIVKRLLTDGRLEAGYTATPYNISALPAGNYILQLRTAENILSHKIIIKH